MNEHTKERTPGFWMVLDNGFPEFCAGWKEACHEHINEAIDDGDKDAAEYVVREFVLKSDLDTALSDAAKAKEQRNLAWNELREIRIAVDANEEESTADEVRRVVAKVKELEEQRDAAYKSAIEDVILEWEKPYGLTDGRKFIDRLRDMLIAKVEKP